MQTKTGYRQMLRDRLPKIVNFALKWCKCKEAWIDHVYKTQIWIYSSNEERLKAAKSVLGLNKTPRVFTFSETIQYDNMSKDDIEYWTNVVNWVAWFQKKYAYVENMYTISKHQGKDIKSIKFEIMVSYLKFMCPTVSDDEDTRIKKNNEVNKFVDFLINCFENNI